MASLFTIPFNVSAKDGKLLITHNDPSLVPAPDTVLRLRGTNWAGFQSHGCPNHLTWHTFEDYLSRLVDDLEMNFVRLPLSAEWINGNLVAENYICGEYRHWSTLQVLDDALGRLAARGVFVMLDLHTLHSDCNGALWCDANNCGAADAVCNTENEQPTFDAWQVLAQRYCSYPNVIMADLFNEPHGPANWGGGNNGTDWRSATATTTATRSQ